MWRTVSRKKCLLALAGSIILAFGLYNIHSISNVTEGGILGLTLLLQYLLGLSPAVTSLALNLLCYAVGWRTLGRDFLVYSLIATGGFSAAYAVFEKFPPLWPGIADLPLLAAVLGALFVGVGAGLSVRAGGATGGDDALAMSLSKLTGWGIQWIYLACDLLVLGASLIYIPWRRIVYSLLTVVISGQIVGFVQRAGNRTAADAADTDATDADTTDTDGKKDR